MTDLNVQSQVASGLVLFVLGQKGFSIVKAAVDYGLAGRIVQVVVAQDRSVLEDFSDEICSFCRGQDISYCRRENFVSGPSVSKDKIAFAAGWKWLIKDSFRQIVVFHDSLLPKYRGFNPLVTALLNRDPVIGVTAIIANKDFDRGDIISSAKVPICYPITLARAMDLVCDLYYGVAQTCFAKLVVQEVFTGVPQDESEASYSVWRDEADYRIEWHDSAENIVHFVNCVTFPYKGASTLCNGFLIRILEATELEDVDVANRGIGKVLFVEGDKPVIICGSGLLRIDMVVNEHGETVLPFSKFRTRLY